MEEKSEIFGSDREEDLKKIIEELIEKMGFTCSVAVEEAGQDDESKGSYVCNVRTEDSSFLIGQHGINLDSLQHIARLVVRKKVDERISFSLDVNSYRQERTDSILSMAKNLAEQAFLERRAVVMRPMSAYERRIVHLALSQEKKVKTESIGEGEDRRIVIKPLDLI